MITLFFSDNRIKFLWFVAALYLSGCATTAPQQPPAIHALSPSVLHQHHMAQITKIAQFSLKGRLGVITKPKGFSGRVAWQHQSEKDNIDVFSPLGGKVANIVKTPDQVILTDNKEKNTKAQDVETLTEDSLGFRLPLSGLSNWALGKPHDRGLVNAVTWDANGRINTLKQNGWDIEYADYADNDGYFLPRKIILKNEKMTLKLIVEKWSNL